MPRRGSRETRTGAAASAASLAAATPPRITARRTRPRANWRRPIRPGRLAMTETAQQSASRYRANLQGEVDSAGLYRALAEAEADPKVSEVYRRLSAVEEAHAEFWRGQLARVGAKTERLQPDWRTRSLAWLARRFGPQFVLPTLSTLEQRDVGMYDRQPEAVAGGLPAAERSHNRVVQAL